MMDGKSTLIEKNGLMLFQGLPVRRGDQIEVDGVMWNVLGAGRSTGRSQAPFLWVRSERFGTSILAPALDPHSPHRTPRPIEKETFPRLSYPTSGVVDSATISDLTNAEISPAILARFKKEIAMPKLTVPPVALKPKPKVFMTAPRPVSKGGGAVIPSTQVMTAA